MPGLAAAREAYRELFAFTEDEADLFFGRAAFVEELEKKLERHAFAAVLGPSGSGKSSVVLAGLVPRLRERGWQVATCRPLRDPLYQLTYGLAPLLGAGADDFDARTERAEKWVRRLRDDPGRILDLGTKIASSDRRSGQTLLVIDQFEELFTEDADAPDGGVARQVEVNLEDGSPRQGQLISVLEAIARQDPHTSPIRAVVTMRADFLNQALEIGRLADLLRDADVKLGPMNVAELTQAVRKPAAKFDVSFEDGLAEEMVAAMQGRTGGLPLLQVALDRLWRKQSERQLRWKDYRGADGEGGLESALNEHAEEVMQRLGLAAEAGVRRLMLRLVRLSEGSGSTPDTRAVVRLRDLKPEDGSLVQKLAEERLVMIGADPVTRDETVELVHEALIGAWGRLQDWLVDDRSFGLWRQRLKASVEQWTSSSDEGDLLRGRQLGEALGWLSTTRRDDLNDVERRFIQSSETATKDAADRALKEAQDRERLANELAKGAQQRERLALELAEAARQREGLANDLAGSQAKALENEKMARKRQSRMITGLFAAIGLLVMAFALSLYFYRESERQRLVAEASAERERTTANAEEEAATQADIARQAAEKSARESKGRQLGAEAVAIQRLPDAENAELAAALAIEGWKRFPTEAAFEAAKTAIRELPQNRIEHESPVGALAFSSDGKLLAPAPVAISARATAVARASSERPTATRLRASSMVSGSMP